MASMAFIASMRIETKPFLRRVGIHTKGTVAAFPCYRFRLCGRDCLLVESGIGIQRGIKAARALLSLCHPHLLVSFGVAGAPSDGLRVGDVIIARAVSYLDSEPPSGSRVLARLSDPAEAAAVLALKPRGAQFFSGTAITTRGAQTLPFPGQKTLRPILEMETAGIAQVASELSIPLLSLRAVSDSVEEPLPFNLEEILDEKQNFRMWKIITALVRHPSRIPRALRAGRNAARAAENLAVAMIAALEKHFSIA